jgi:hypothetical protein
MPQLFPLENSILYETKQKMDNWLLEKPEKNDIQVYYHWLDEIVLKSYQDLFGIKSKSGKFKFQEENINLNFFFVTTRFCTDIIFIQTILLSTRCLLELILYPSLKKRRT